MRDGAASILGGMTLLGLTDNLVRLISEDASLWQFHLLRSLMALPLLALAALALGMRLRPRRPGAVAARSAVQTCAMLVYFGALPTLPIAEVGAALFTAPIWVLLFSAAFFGRRVGARACLAVALGFAGVLVMLRPDPGGLSAFAFMPLAAGALYGLSNLLTREWCAEEPVGALLVGFFGGLAIASLAALALLAAAPPPDAWRQAAPFLTEGWRAPSAAMLGWILAQAAGSLAAVGLIARGYQAGDTGPLAVFEYVFLLTANFWAWALWGDGLEPVDFLGIAMIVASGALIAGAGPGRSGRGPKPSRLTLA